MYFVHGGGDDQVRHGGGIVVVAALGFKRQQKMFLDRNRKHNVRTIRNPE